MPCFGEKPCKLPTCTGGKANISPTGMYYSRLFSYLHNSSSASQLIRQREEISGKKSFTTKSTKDTKIHKELQKKEPERVIDLLGSSS
jgi:hypothetical protein